ncbi:allergen Bos d 2-like [Physeter macrocephalus]|uniref:Allergen Bos d 2-like n=1 Tax=Physeter macrocephalus TaxID=9755 RepID=A0A9W2WTJ7_PHYMC|nr:allergen Bos d 2-like [Physeter catodon]
MKILLLSLVFGLVCADQEPPSEEALSKITGEWHTIYIASDNVDKTHGNGPLRGHIHRTEGSNNCETTYITFYTKINGLCQGHTAMGTRREKDNYGTDCESVTFSDGGIFSKPQNVFKVSGRNYFQLIILSKNMLVIYAESIDEDKTTHLTEVVGFERTSLLPYLLWNPAKGHSLSEEEFNKFEELSKDKRVPTENTEDVIATEYDDQSSKMRKKLKSDEVRPQGENS